MQAIRQTLAQLESEKKGGAKISQSVAPPGAELSGDQALVRSLDMNPVYQNLRLALSQADADVAELRGQMSAQQALVAELRSRVNSIPEIEAELSRLNRDYEVNKQQYDTLLQRFESAKISQSADQNTENVKFRIIEPPTVPVRPSGPQRQMLNSLVLLAALAAGLGVAVLLAQMHPTFATKEVLEKIAGIPVLGSISAALRLEFTPWYRRESTLILGAAAALLVAYGLNTLLTDTLRAALQNVIG